MKNTIIISNKIRCNICGDTIESKNTHDFIRCSCGRCFVDGGHEYLRRGFKFKTDYTELSETREKTVLDYMKEREEARAREIEDREKFLAILDYVLSKEDK